MDKKNFEEWIDLEGVELERTYHFPDGFDYTITLPAKLFVKKSGSHKLVDSTGRLHYIKASWAAFSATGQWAFDVE